MLTKSDIVHVLPINDLHPHVESALCDCNPKIKEGGRLIIHNSYDGREVFEEAEALRGEKSEILQ